MSRDSRKTSISAAEEEVQEVVITVVFGFGSDLRASNANFRPCSEFVVSVCSSRLENFDRVVFQVSGI
jgi:hypothetical protein